MAAASTRANWSGTVLTMSLYSPFFSTCSLKKARVPEFSSRP